MKIRYAKKTEKNIAIKFWRDSFTDSQEQIDFYFDKIYREKNYLVLEENKKIVSSLHENDYIFNFNSQSVASKYIVGVSSDLTQRNRGYMSKLIKAMLENLKKKDIPFVFLTPINPEIYRRYGFEYFSNIEHYHFLIENLSSFKFPTTDYNFNEISKENRNLYIHDLIKIYNFNMKNNFCFLERNEVYFEKLLAECDVDKMKTFILYKDNVASAYIIFSLSENNIDIRECFAVDREAHKEILALIYGYRDYYQNINLASSNNSNIEFLFPNQLNIEKKIQPFMMLRILEPLFIFKNLNLKKSNLRIYLKDDLIRENTGLYILGDEIIFSNRENLKDTYDIKLDIKDLSPLVSGYLSFDKLYYLNKIEINKNHLSSENKKESFIKKLNEIFYIKNSYLYEFI